MIRKCSFLVLLISILSIQAILWAAEPEEELFEKGRNSYLEQQYGFALELFNDFEEYYPLSDYMPDLQYYRAVSLFQLGRNTEALNAFAGIKSKYRTTAYLPIVDFWEGMSY